MPLPLQTFSVELVKRMTREYRVETPALSGSAFAMQRNGEGGPTIFSLGSDGFVHRLFEDESSDTGWNVEKLGFDADDIFRLTDTAGADHIYVVTRRIHGGFAELIQDPGGTFRLNTLGFTLGPTSSLTAAHYGDQLVLMGRAEAGPGIGRATGIQSPPTGIGIFALTNPDGHPAGDAPLLDDGAPSLVTTDKVVCLPDIDGSAWPHLRIASLYRGTLTLYRGEEATDPRFLVPSVIPLPPLAGVIDFAVAVASHGRVLILAVDGSSALHLLSGKPDAGAPGGMRFEAAWASRALTGGLAPSFRTVTCECWQDGTVEALLRDDTGALWTTRQDTSGGSGWVDALVFEPQCTTVATHLTERGTMAMLIASPDRRLVYWAREVGDDWRSTPIALGTGETLQTLNVYRAILNVADQYGASVPRSPFAITASDACAITVNGRSLQLRPDVPVSLFTDGAGSIAIVLEIRDSLLAPILTLDARFLAAKGGRLQLRVDGETQGFLADVTPKQLLAVLPPNRQGEAEPVSQVIRHLFAMTHDLYAPQEMPADAGFTLKPQRGLRFVDAGSRVSPNRIEPAPAPAGAWRVGVNAAGALDFATLTAEEFDVVLACARADRATGLPWPPDLPIDLGDVWEALGSGAAAVEGIAVRGAEAVVSLLVNGLHRTLSFVIHTVEDVFDAVVGVFRWVEVEFESVVTWLIETIGFLFDWDAIKKTRDHLKGTIRYLGENPPSIPDPLASEAYWDGWLQELDDHIEEWLNEIRNSPLGSQPTRRTVGEVPPIAGWFAAGGTSFFDAATWLMEKATSALANLIGGSAAPLIPGLDAVLDALVAALLRHADRIEETVASLATVLMGWTTHFASLETGNVTTILALLVEPVHVIVAALRDVLHAMCQALSLFLTNIPTLIAWMDAPMTVPFLSAFYQDVLDTPFSLFDLVCLIMAIPLTIAGVFPGDLRAGSGAIAFVMATSVIFTAIGEFGNILLEEPFNAGHMTALFSMFIYFLLIAVDSAAVNWHTFAYLGMTSAVMSLIFGYLRLKEPLNASLQGAYFGVRAFFSCLGVYSLFKSENHDDNELTAKVLSFIAWAASAVVFWKGAAGKSPLNIGNAVLQVGVGAAIVFLFMESFPPAEVAGQPA